MISHQRLGKREDADTRIVWAHGWGHSGAAMRPLAEAFSGRVENILLDLPGFGASPLPQSAWGNADYADAVAEFLNSLPPMARTIWIGHSFGCRVGIHFAVRHPAMVERMVLIAAAGLKRRRTPGQQIRFLWRSWSFKALKRLYSATGRDPAVLAGRYGSPDYRNAGAMRPIFVRVIAEDLADIASQVRCPVQLVFGRDDTETPPEFGERYSVLMPNAKLAILDHQDHYSVLGEGRHAVIKIISDFIRP